ncbi:hypothetical protein BKA70DRAFT_1452017 [Coprinopsis sp. MPI-PUGE-AT-0042]|nr:hypothetical protein BKA70DRAFT_1452017 [Coprinopsis sp. MPI-PUGE-AT-0042]
MPEFPRVAGFTLVENSGGGGFSMVYKSVNFTTQRAAACKLISLAESTSEKERKTLDKKIKVHTALKHINILEFLNVLIVDLKHKLSY